MGLVTGSGTLSSLGSRPLPWWHVAGPTHFISGENIRVLAVKHPLQKWP